MRLEFRRHGGVLETGIPSAWGGFNLDFQRGKGTRDSLDDADCVRRLWYERKPPFGGSWDTSSRWGSWEMATPGNSNPR